MARNTFCNRIHNTLSRRSLTFTITQWRGKSHFGFHEQSEESKIKHFYPPWVPPRGLPEEGSVPIVFTWWHCVLLVVLCQVAFCPGWGWQAGGMDTQARVCRFVLLPSPPSANYSTSSEDLSVFLASMLLFLTSADICYFQGQMQLGTNSQKASSGLCFLGVYFLFACDLHKLSPNGDFHNSVPVWIQKQVLEWHWAARYTTLNHSTLPSGGSHFRS